ncbi:MAG: hypothetical protein Q9202_000235 [Teloschistes flavicans]
MSNNPSSSAETGGKYNHRSHVDLVQLCVERGLKSTGKDDTLIIRLQEYDTRAAQEERSLAESQALQVSSGAFANRVSGGSCNKRHQSIYVPNRETKIYTFSTCEEQSKVCSRERGADYNIYSCMGVLRNLLPAFSPPLAVRGLHHYTRYVARFSFRGANEPKIPGENLAATDSTVSQDGFDVEITASNSTGHGPTLESGVVGSSQGDFIDKGTQTAEAPIHRRSIDTAKDVIATEGNADFQSPSAKSHIPKAPYLPNLEEKYEVEIKDYKAKIEDYKKEIEGYTEEIEDYKARIEDYKKEIEDYKKETRQFEIFKNQKDQSVNELVQQNEMTTKIIMTKDDKIDELRDELKLWIEKNVELQHSLRRERERYENLFTQMQRIRGNVWVAARMRDMNSSEKYSDRSETSAFTIDGVNAHVCSIKPPGILVQLDFAFGPNDSNEYVGRDLAPILGALLDSHNVCIIADGQSNTGKSYTMYSGPNSLVASAVSRIFFIVQSIDDARTYHKSLSKTGGVESRWQLKLSVLEIYLEKTYDLLSPRGCKSPLEVRSPEFLRSESIVKPDHILPFMDLVSHNRNARKTQKNGTSSRGHVVIIVTLTNKDLAKVAKLYLVDLAGSERLDGQDPGFEKETRFINESRTEFRQAIKAFREGRRHQPTTKAVKVSSTDNLAGLY